jgi:hypothetical protein
VTTEMLHRLMDGVDGEHLAAARRATEAVPGVRAIAVRGRWTGLSLTLDVHGRGGGIVAMRLNDQRGQLLGAQPVLFLQRRVQRGDFSVLLNEHLSRPTGTAKRTGRLARRSRSNRV